MIAPWGPKIDLPDFVASYHYIIEVIIVEYDYVSVDVTFR